MGIFQKAAQILARWPRGIKPEGARRLKEMYKSIELKTE
jgi:hypothetical protein